MNSQIITHPGGAMSFVGRPAVDVFRALALARALTMYARTGIKANRAYTPTNMRRVAEQITGHKFRARDYAGMAQALREWAADQRTNIEFKPDCVTPR